MAEQAGHSSAAIVAARSALSARRAAAAEADRALAAALADAHTTTVEALRRLDQIETDIESAVAQQETLSLDTPAGAHELHRFLIAKQREIAAVVSDAAAEGAAKTAVLEELLAHYALSPQASTT